MGYINSGTPPKKILIHRKGNNRFGGFCSDIKFKIFFGDAPENM